jgi:mannose-6-phosphate isomerase-like protein (cupin superfamily)
MHNPPMDAHMALIPFALEDSLIAYSDARRATRIERSFQAFQNPDHDYFLVVFDFEDDQSLHADHWERHPTGDEILCLLQGRLLAAVETDGASEEAVIEEGQAVIFPAAAWHRLRVLAPGRLLVFTPRAGSELRPHRPDANLQPAEVQPS